MSIALKMLILITYSVYLWSDKYHNDLSVNESVKRPTIIRTTVGNFAQIGMITLKNRVGV